MERRPRTGGRPDGHPARVEERVVLVALVVVAAALRWRWLGQPIRYDEAVTWLEYASRPLAEGLSRYDLPNNHLFHTLLVHLSADAFGSGVHSLRLPALAAGVLTVPATWALGRRLYGPSAGLLAAAAVSVSPVLVLFSTNARGYSLVVLAFLVLALLAVELRRRRSFLLWAAFAAAAALAGWTMPSALYPAVAVGIWLLWPERTGEATRSLTGRAAGLAGASVAAAGATAVLYVPVLRRSGWRSVVANRFVAADPPGEFVAEVPGFLASVVGEWAHGAPTWAVALLVLGAVAATVREVTAAPDGPPPLFPAAVAGALLLLGATRRAPFARVWLFLLPAFAVFASSGLRELAAELAGRFGGEAGTTIRRARRAAAGLALLVLAGGGAHLLRGDPVASWGLTGSLPAGDRVAGLLARRMEPGDAVRAPLPSDAPLEYYFERMGLDRDRVNDVPAPGGCLWIVVNRRRRNGTVPGVLTSDDGERRRLVRDFGASAVHVNPTGESGGLEEPGDGEATDHPCGAGGGEAAGPRTDSPGRPPARGGEEPPER